jgi:hypothetical protein
LVVRLWLTRGGEFWPTRPGALDLRKEEQQRAVQWPSLLPPPVCSRSSYHMAGVAAVLRRDVGRRWSHLTAGMQSEAVASDKRTSAL